MNNKVLRIRKVVVLLLALSIIIIPVQFILCINIAAYNDDAPFGKERMPNGWGYWHTYQLGFRFSLVDKYGTVEKIVDVFDLKRGGAGSGIVRTVHGKRADVLGASEDILSKRIYNNDGSVENSNTVEFRIFNRCKIAISHLSYDDIKNFETNMVLVPAGNNTEYEYKRNDNSIKWYCADVRDVFKNVDGLNNFNSDYRLFDMWNDGEGDYVWVRTDAVDNFICEHITGHKRKTLLSFNPDQNAWIGMCDLLYSLGLDVYNGLEGNDVRYLDNKDKTKLYNNLIEKFVEKDYCVVAEPIMFWGVPLFERKYDDKGREYYERIRTSIYYGSVTELGILEALNEVGGNDGEYISKEDVDHFDTLHESVVTRFVGQQCAYVTEEYEYELKKYAGEDSLSVVEANDYIGWRFENDNNNRYKYEDVGYEFTAYSANIIKNYATAMTLIASSDFIKPQVETYDSEYRSNTNVVTSIKVSNRSDTNYSTMIDSSNISSNTSLNANGVPKAMLCKFTVSKITDESGEVGRWTADRSAVTTQFQQKVEELGFAKDESGNYITEFYGSLDGLLPREITNANAPCYVSFNWKTPKKPCKVTFEVEFLNANSNPEPVLGTDEHDGLRTTEMDEDMRNIYGKYITYFNCDIVEGANTTLFTEDTVPPDSVSIISVSPNAAPGSDEQKLYDINKGIYDAYQAAHGTTPAVYTGTDFAGKTIVDSQSWSEYVARYDGGGNIVLTHKPHTVSISLSKTTDDTYTDSTTKILRTDQSGLYSDYADTIGSGYGIGVDFISSYSNDEAGVDYIRDVTVNGVTYQNSLVTNYDHGVVMFPEYNYQTYYGELLQFDTDVDLGGRSAEKRFMFTANKDSKFYGDAVDRPAGMSDEEYAEYAEMNRDEKSRVHFTPVWYPDGKYQIVMCMFDAWTPAGELWFYKTYDIEIKGSIYDTWYITRTYKNQVAS